MKHISITAGMGTVDDYLPYTAAGANELFCGYIPHASVRRFGARTPLNRREVLFANVQLGSRSELMILSDMVRARRVPAALAFNSPLYTDEQRAFIIDCLKDLRPLGFRDVIVADLPLIRQLCRETDLRIHVSGELSELNRLTVRILADMGVHRIIFPRQTALAEMEAVIRAVPTLEYEAFVLNEKCHFTGAYCATLHCDALPPICRVPYTVSGLPEPEPTSSGQDCGLCALYRLRDMGVSFAKLVSRGNTTQSTVQDIRLLKAAIRLAEAVSSEDDFIRAVKQSLFPNGCSGNCYYP